MAKKLKIISTVLVLCFVIVMIPIAIMAASNVNPRISSTLQYLVEEIEGEFFYKIYGNAAPETHDIPLSTLFYTEKDGEDILLKNSTGEILPNNQTIQINNNNILFDVDHQTVSYYFVFANYGENLVEGDDRGVIVTASSNNWTNFNDYVTASWSYVVKQKDEGSRITFTDVNNVESDPNLIAQGEANFNLLSGVRLDPLNAETQKYEYIIIKYELVLKTATNSFDTGLSLRINLNSTQTS